MRPLLVGRVAHGVAGVLFDLAVEPEANPRRRRLLALVEERPGISFEELVRDARLTAPNALYHLEVLLRAQLLQEFRVLRRLCYAPYDADVARVKTESFLRFDPKLARVREILAQEPSPPSRLVERLREDFDLSQVAAWKLVERAVEAGLAERLVQGRRIVIRAC